MSNTIMQNWPIILFLFAQVVGSWKILSNIKGVNQETNTGLKVIEVRINALEQRIITQNSRVDKLEAKHEILSNSIAAHHGTQH